MTIRMNGALSRRLAGSALAGLIAFAVVPPAAAQWLPPPWRFAPPPVAIERNLEAQGYVLTAPLMRRPGVYLADVSAGPAGYQRLIIDSRSGAILERFAVPGRIWGPTLASRGEEFGEPPPVGLGGLPASGEFSGAPRPAAPAKSAHPGPANIHIPAAISPYDSGEAPGAKPKAKSVSRERKPPATKPAAPAINPPLPPPAPREAAKSDGSGPAASQPVESHDLDQPRIDSRPTEVDAGPPPSAPGSSAEASEKPKVNIVPSALFE
jgi:hypothetical protein